MCRFCIYIFFIFVILNASSQAIAAVRGRIIYARGNITLKNTKTLKRVSKGYVLSDKEILIVGSKSQAVIKMNDASVWMCASGSSIAIGDRRSSKVKVLRGRMFVKAPLGVQITGFAGSVILGKNEVALLHAMSDKKMRVSTLKGKVICKGKKVVVLKAGKTILLGGEEKVLRVSKKSRKKILNAYRIASKPVNIARKKRAKNARAKIVEEARVEPAKPRAKGRRRFSIKNIFRFPWLRKRKKTVREHPQDKREEKTALLQPLENDSYNFKPNKQIKRKKVRRKNKPRITNSKKQRDIAIKRAFVLKKESSKIPTYTHIPEKNQTKKTAAMKKRARAMLASLASDEGVGNKHAEEKKQNLMQGISKKKTLRKPKGKIKTAVRITRLKHPKVKTKNIKKNIGFVIIKERKKIVETPIALPLFIKIAKGHSAALNYNERKITPPVIWTIRSMRPVVGGIYNLKTISAEKVFAAKKDIDKDIDKTLWDKWGARSDTADAQIRIEDKNKIDRAEEIGSAKAVALEIQKEATPPKKVNALGLPVSTKYNKRPISEKNIQASKRILEKHSGIGKNTMPVAISGDEQAIRLGSSVFLDGSKSYDKDNDPLAFTWSQISGPTGVLSSSLGKSVKFTPLKHGLHRFSLIVSDGVFESKQSIVSILVAPREVKVSIPNIKTESSAPPLERKCSLAEQALSIDDLLTILHGISEVTIRGTNDVMKTIMSNKSSLLLRTNDLPSEHIVDWMCRSLKCWYHIEDDGKIWLTREYGWLTDKHVQVRTVLVHGLVDKEQEKQPLEEILSESVRLILALHSDASITIDSQHETLTTLLPNEGEKRIKTIIETLERSPSKWMSEKTLDAFWNTKISLAMPSALAEDVFNEIIKRTNLSWGTANGDEIKTRLKTTTVRAIYHDVPLKQVLEDLFSVTDIRVVMEKNNAVWLTLDTSTENYFPTAKHPWEGVIVRMYDIRPLLKGGSMSASLLLHKLKNEVIPCAWEERTAYLGLTPSKQGIIVVHNEYVHRKIGEFLQVMSDIGYKMFLPTKKERR